ncbi:MAG: hypothetical protein ACXWQO_01205 [Bdellovibrionota bacterium]
MESKIVQFLQRAHPARQENPFTSADLFKDEWLDSLLQLRLLTYLESEFQIYFPAVLVSLRNFQSISSIAELVRKLQNAGTIA